MDLRREFIKRLATGERLTDLCREYGISRKTGSKFKRRFEELGVTGLADQSRAPKVIPHKTPPGGRGSHRGRTPEPPDLGAEEAQGHSRASAGGRDLSP